MCSCVKNLSRRNTCVACWASFRSKNASIDSSNALLKFLRGETICNEPIGVLSHKEGVNCCLPDGQAASTTFVLIKHEPHTSLVKAFPHSGRQHQIRCHLQFLGYPIANDPIYASGELTKIKLAQSSQPATIALPNNAPTSPFVIASQPYREKCEECDCEVVLFDSQNFELWLHARALSGRMEDGSAFSFEVSMPAWAAKPPELPPPAVLSH